MPAFIDENQQFIDPETNAPIVAGQVFFGEKGSNPTAAPIDVFTDRELTTVIAQPILTDASGRTTVKIWIPGLYSFKVLTSATSGGAQKLIDEDAGTSEAVGTAVLTNVIGSDNITAQASPVITTLIDGTQFTFTAVGVNTANMTLNIDGTGAKRILFNFSEEMAPGFIRQNQIVNITYNAVGAPASDNFVWNNEGRGISILTSIAGTANDITAVGGPSITTNYVNGQLYSFIANVNNTGAVTLKIGALPTVSIKNKGVELSADQLVANITYIVSFDLAGNVFELVNAISNINNANIADGAVTSSKIASNAVIVGKIAANAVGNSEIAANAVDTSELATGAVTSGKLDANAVIAGKIAANAVDTSELATGAVTSGKLDANAVISGKIAANAVGQSEIATSAVGQGELITGSGEVSTSATRTLITGAGGDFGMWPTIRQNNATAARTFVMSVSSIIAASVYTSPNQTLGTSFLQRFHLGSSTTAVTVFAKSTFIQSSPPYDLGDGECHTFIFAIVGRNGKVESMYHAPDPPWANNGPTIKSCIHRPTSLGIDVPVQWEQNGKIYRKRKIIDKTKEFFDPARHSIIDQEMTVNFKNSDMALIPHPFQGNDMTGKSIILIDPCCDIVRIAEKMKEWGESALEELFHNEYVRFGNQHLSGRATPDKDVMVVKPYWKNSK